MKKLLEQKDYSLWRCESCGIVKTIAEFDDTQYESVKELESQYEIQKDIFEKYAKDIYRHFPIKSGRMLDIGCGLGWLVSLAQKEGFKAQGIDGGRACVTVGKKILKANIKLSKLENFKSKYKFDLITANHVIEHADKPIEFVKQIKKNLKKGGWVLISCPNFDSLMCWIFQERWYGLVPHQHRFQYSKKPLIYLLEHQGFKVKNIIVDNLDYRVFGWKGIIFQLLTRLSLYTGTGDQITIIAKYG